MSSGKLKPLQAGDPEGIGGYRLLARLGAGGMGRVYLARSKGGRAVAVKVIHPHLAEDPQFRRRFEKEVAAARRVGGIHTVHVVDADAAAEPPWLVTEYVAGPSLQEAVAEHGPFPAKAVAGLGAGLAEGLTAVHARAVVHRDLKPGNVLLAQDGPRIIDFGIARALDASSQTTSVVGTPGFMSPEQLRGREVGPASDVFSLAAVLVFAATGRRPFGDGPPEALGYRVVNEDPDLTGVPEELGPLLAAGLAKDPDARPGLAEVLDRCSALLDGGEPQLPPLVDTMIATRVAETEVLLPPLGGASRERSRPRWARGQWWAQGPRWVKGPRWAPAAGAAAVAVVLLAAFAFLNLTGDEHAPASGAVPEVTAPTTSPAPTTPTPTPSESDAASERPRSNPTRKAFEKIKAGDCLNAHRSPDGSDKWSKDKPKAVSCSRPDAYVRVTKVGDEISDCSDGDGEIDGELWWSYGEEPDEIALCVSRQLRVGDCFLALDGAEEDSVSISNGNLMTSWPCGKRPLPGSYDHILKVTALTGGSCPPARRSVDFDFRGGKLCVRLV